MDVNDLERRRRIIKTDLKTNTLGGGIFIYLFFI